MLTSLDLGSLTCYLAADGVEFLSVFIDGINLDFGIVTCFISEMDTL